MMVTCSFSGDEIPRGTGIMYVTKTGKVLYFKNSKAYKNMVGLGRIPRRTSWTREFFTIKNKERK